MTRATIILGAALVLLNAANAAIRPKETVRSLERAICGEWRGGACQGTWTFRADGTFQLTHYSPGNNTLSGTWGVRWTTPRPTLGITINQSDCSEQVGTKWELKVIQLDDDELTCQLPAGSEIRLRKTKR
jgi:hypothetical protein